MGPAGIPYNSSRPGAGTNIGGFDQLLRQKLGFGTRQRGVQPRDQVIGDGMVDDERWRDQQPVTIEAAVLPPGVRQEASVPTRSWDRRGSPGPHPTPGTWVAADPLAHQCFLVAAAELLDSIFLAQGGAPCGEATRPNQGHRQVGAGVSGGPPGLMLPQPRREILGDTGIEGAVAATQHIHEAHRLIIRSQ